MPMEEDSFVGIFFDGLYPGRFSRAPRRRSTEGALWSPRRRAGSL